MKDCPKCKLINPDSALRCDCGYDFPSRSMQRSYLNKQRKVGGALGAFALFYLAWRLIAVGVASNFHKSDFPLIMLISLGIAAVLFSLYWWRVKQDRNDS